MIVMAKWVNKAPVTCSFWWHVGPEVWTAAGAISQCMQVTFCCCCFLFLFLVINFKMPPPHVTLTDAGVNTAIVCISTVHLYLWNCNVHKRWCAFIISFTVICGFDKLNELWAVSFICLLGKHSRIGLDVWVEDSWRTLWMSYYKNTWNGVCEDFFIAMELILFRRSVCTERTDECHFITHEKP